jgi:hypothetical protein
MGSSLQYAQAASSTEANRQRLDILSENRLPTLRLMSYGVGFLDLFRRAAVYVDNILKAQSPLISLWSNRRSSSSSSI